MTSYTCSSRRHYTHKSPEDTAQTNLQKTPYTFCSRRHHTHKSPEDTIHKTLQMTPQIRSSRRHHTHAAHRKHHTYTYIKSWYIPNLSCKGFFSVTLNLVISVCTAVLAFFGDVLSTPSYCKGGSFWHPVSSSTSSRSCDVDVAALLTVVLPPRRLNTEDVSC